RLDILRGIMRVGPALRSRKGVCACAKAQIRLPSPILEIVPRLKSRLSPIRNFVVAIPRSFQNFAGCFVEFRHLILCRQRTSAVAGTALKDFTAKAAGLVNFQNINRYVVRTERPQLVQRILPTRSLLMWKSCD